jgi:hypothetical protein
MKIKNTLIESTPCEQVTVTHKGVVVAMFRAYWSQNAGLYGHQICYTYTIDCDVVDGKTDGCGYSKTAAAFQEFIGALYGAGVPSLGGDAAWLIGRHTKTIGNSYKVTRLGLKRLINKAEADRNATNARQGAR